MPIILPKNVPELAPFIKAPMFFLAGPILGGGDWHVPMTQLLRSRFGDPVIANPSHYPETHPHRKEALPGSKGSFRYALEWERHFLAQAAGEAWPSGCIIFWLARESATAPRQDGAPYAMDTRGELGEWRGRLIGNRKVRLVIGAENGFPGLSIIKHNFEAVVPGFKIASTMEETLELAARYT